MAVTRNSAPKPTSSTPQNPKTKTAKKKKNQATWAESIEPTKLHVIRLIGGRIYDSENGKTCHQCRQKTIDFTVTCKNEDVDWRCPIHHYCHKCLLRRYGENAEEAATLVDWKCPKCRGICNCSYCRKRRRDPIGILALNAKANGLASVSDRLPLIENVKVKTNKGAMLKKRKSSDEEINVALSKKRRKGNVVDGITDLKTNNKPLKNGADGHKTEGLQKKKKRKNDLSEKNLKKSTKCKGAYLMKPTTSDKDPAAGFERSKTRGNNSRRSSGGNIQCKPNGTKSSRLQTSRKDKKPEYPLNRKKYAPLEKIDSNNNEISQEVPQERENNSRRGTSVQLIKMNSEKSGSKKVVTEHTRTDTNEADPTKLQTKDDAAKPKKVDEYYLCKKKKMDVQGNSSAVEVPLPQGIELTKLANIDMPAADIGHALQFLEFCEAFGQVLGLKKGQSEMLLKELACGEGSNRRHDLSVVQMHIKLLSLIQLNSGRDHLPLKTRDRSLWLEALKSRILESQCPSKEQMLDILNMGPGGYEELNLQQKLKLMNFLCDEALGTLELRSWIVEQNSEFVKEEKKAAREKVLFDKEKAKNLKQKLQSDVAEAILLRNGAPLSISEHENLVSKIKAEIAQTLAKTLEGPDWEMTKERHSDAVRSEPILFDANGHIFWKLRGYSGRTEILLQDVSDEEDLLTFKERWFIYEVHDKALVEKYIYHHLRHLKNEKCSARW